MLYYNQIVYIRLAHVSHWVNQSVITVSELEIAIASPSFASLFTLCCSILQDLGNRQATCDFHSVQHHSVIVVPRNRYDIFNATQGNLQTYKQTNNPTYRPDPKKSQQP